MTTHDRAVTAEPPPTTPAAPAGAARPAPRARPGRSVFALREFRLLFTAAAVNRLGTQVDLVALPLVAIVALRAAPAEVGLLGVASTAAFLLVGLPAGALVDRARRRRLMVLTDLVRAVSYGSIPLAWWLGVLTLPQLYAVALVSGVATVFFDVSAQSYLPTAVPRDRIVEANAALTTSDGVTAVAGGSLGGVLVQALSAPVAVLADAVSYLWSAACLGRIRRPESPPERPRGATLLRDVGEGVRHVFTDPVLRPLALDGGCTNLSYVLTATMFPVVFVRELGYSQAALGLFLGVGAVGMLAGSATARAVARRVGAGPALWVTSVVMAPFAFLVPLVGHGTALWLAGIGWFLREYKVGVGNVVQVSIRQRVTPDRLLGRMNATFRFVLTGVVSVGAGIAGLLGQFAGARSALWVGAAVLAVSWLPVVFSPVRRMRDLPG